MRVSLRIFGPRCRIVAVVHSDDVVAEGHAQGLAEFEKRLRSCFELACQVTLGPYPDDDKSAVIFNRILTWCDEGLRWEADPRHIEIAVAELGLLSGKSIRPPAVKDKTRRTVQRCSHLSLPGPTDVSPRA